MRLSASRVQRLVWNLRTRGRAVRAAHGIGLWRQFGQMLWFWRRLDTHDAEVLRLSPVRCRHTPLRETHVSEQPALAQTAGAVEPESGVQAGQRQDGVPMHDARARVALSAGTRRGARRRAERRRGCRPTRPAPGDPAAFRHCGQAHRRNGLRAGNPGLPERNTGRASSPRQRHRMDATGPHAGDGRWRRDDAWRTQGGADVLDRAAPPGACQPRCSVPGDLLHLPHRHAARWRRCPRAGRDLQGRRGLTGRGQLRPPGSGRVRTADPWPCTWTWPPASWGGASASSTTPPSKRTRRQVCASSECACRIWDEALSLVRRAARAFPDLLTLGWDVGFTDEGPIVLEANPHWAEDLTSVPCNAACGARR